MNILIISSSVRPGRKSHWAALGVQKYLQQSSDTEVRMIDLMEYPLPLLESTFGAQKEPDPQVEFLNSELHWADAMVFVSPEYNGSYSSALKNFVDTFAKAPFQDKPIGVCSVTTGPLGGMRGALQMQQLVLAIFGFPMPNMLLVPKVAEQFATDGSLLNPAYEAKMEGFCQKLLWFTKRMMQGEAIKA
ncbi:MAG: NAD(P)H-dependent oxidoreductase [Bacteroidota bacterium]